MIVSDAPQSLDEMLVVTEELDWRPKSLAGVHEKVLWRDDSTGASIVLIRFEQGVGIPEPHVHASNQFMFCLSGRYEYTATRKVLTAGSFYWNPTGNVHGPTIAHEETVFLEIFDGPHYPERPSWYADDQDAR
jgi:2,4'-dihydroxyacetophenone dioxygenase